MKHLTFSRNGFLIGVDVYASQVNLGDGPKWYPRMHRSGEMPTNVPKDLSKMSYKDRWPYCETLGFETEIEALEHAEKQCKLFYAIN